MAGTDTIRGIHYQQAHAVALAIEVIADPSLGAMRVEGKDDIVDVELWDVSDRCVRAAQYKIRQDSRTWGVAEIVKVLNRWLNLDESETVQFSFQTNGEFGPSVVSLQQEVAAYVHDGIEATLATRGLVKFDRNKLSKLKLVQHDVDADAILNEAILAMVRLLPAALVNGTEVFNDAQARVLRLFAEMFTAGSNPDASKRLLTRQQLADIAEINLANIPAESWSDVRDQLLTHFRNQRPSLLFDFELPDTYTAGQWIEHIGRTSLLEVPTRDNAPRVFAETFASYNFSLLAGSTGMGKTTAIANAQRRLAHNSKVALVINSDYEYRGDLVRAATGVIASILGKPVGPSIARHAFDDPDVTLVVDRASELSDELRLQLKNDLANLDAQTVRICLTGREIGTLKALCPGTPEEFATTEFKDNDQTQLSEALWESKGKSKDSAHAALLKIRTLLGDLTNNPLLLTVGHWLELNNRLPTSRADLYASTLDLLGERASESELSIQLPIIGGVFSRLIDDRQWSTNFFKWHRVLEELFDALPGTLRTNPAVPRSTDAAINSGVISNNVAHNQIRALHDSFADYLAALAIRESVCDAPKHPTWADARRLEFLQELEELKPEAAIAITRANPLLVARLSFNPSPFHKQPDKDVVLECLTAVFAIPRTSMTLDLTVNDSWFWGHLTIDADALPGNSGRIRVSAGSKQGSLQLAIGLWEAVLAQRLFGPSSKRLPDLSSPEKARIALEVHAAQVKKDVHSLVNTDVPDANRKDVLSAIGPLGLQAVVGPAQESQYGQYFPVHYDNASEIGVVTVGAVTDLSMSGQTDVAYFVRQSPRATRCRACCQGIL